MAKEIKFQVTLTVNGKEQLVTATTDLKELHKTLQDTKSRTKQLSDGFIYLNQKLQTFKTVVSSFQELGSTFADLTEESRAFSLAMRQTNTLAGKDEAGFEKMRDQVNDLAQAINRQGHEHAGLRKGERIGQTTNNKDSSVWQTKLPTLTTRLKTCSRLLTPRSSARP